MLENDFLPLIVVAAVAFGAGLVWVFIEWAKADKNSDAIEREVQQRLVQRRIDPVSAARIPFADEEEAARIDKEETVLARLLFWWGLVATAMGMAFGAIPYGFTGALLGAVIGPVVSTGGVVLYIAVRGMPKEVTAKATSAETVADTDLAGKAIGASDPGSTA